MDLSKLLNCCDIRSFSESLGEFMLSKAEKAYRMAEDLADTVNDVEDVYEAFSSINPEGTLIEWREYARNNLSRLERIWHTTDLSSIHFLNVASDGSIDLQSLLDDQITNVYNTAHMLSTERSKISQMTIDLSNSANSCIAESVAYDVMSMFHNADEPSIISMFMTKVDRLLDASNPTVAAIENFIETKMRNSTNIVDYIIKSIAMYDVETTVVNTKTWEYTGTHPIFAFSITFDSVLSGIISSWKITYNLFKLAFQSFITIGSRLIDKVYNWFQSITVDPRCVSYNNSGQEYTIDGFYHETVAHFEPNKYPSLFEELRKGPISINLHTSENVFFISEDTDERVVITRRHKFKLLGDLKPVFESYDDRLTAFTATDEQLTQIVEDIIMSTNPDAVSTQVGGEMLKGFYETELAEQFIVQYLLKQYDYTYDHGVGSDWHSIYTRFIKDQTGNNLKYYKFASSGAKYDIGLKEYVDTGTIESRHWSLGIYGLLDSILFQQKMPGMPLHDAFLPYSHKVVNFRSSKIRVLTDKEISHSWNAKVGGALLVIAAVTVTLIVLKKLKTAVLTHAAQRDALYYKMQDEYLKNGSISMETLKAWKTENRKTNNLKMMTSGLTSNSQELSNLSNTQTTGLNTIISLINPEAAL